MFYILIIFFAKGLEITSTGDSEQRVPESDYRCEDISVGKHRVVDFDSPDNSPRHTDRYKMNYVLHRKSAHVYELAFHLRFKPHRSYDGPNKRGILNWQTDDQLVHNEYIKVLKDCKPYLQGALRGPNGTRFEITINDEKYSSLLTPTEISISRKNFRSNWLNYQSNIDCPTLIHELLHVAGLCDEYTESWMSHEGFSKNNNGSPNLEFKSEKVNMYNCRPKSDRPSIMNNQYDFNSWEYATRNRNLCICKRRKCSSSYSKGRREIIIGTTCPPGYSDSEKDYWDLFVTLRMNHLMSPHGIVKNNRIDKQVFIDRILSMDRDNFVQGAFLNRVRILFEWNETPNYTLQPAHVRHLINPGCIEKNQKYYHCAQSAYETSTIEGCSSQKQFCKDGSWLD